MSECLAEKLSDTIYTLLEGDKVYSPEVLKALHKLGVAASSLRGDVASIRGYANTHSFQIAAKGLTKTLEKRYISANDIDPAENARIDVDRYLHSLLTAAVFGTEMYESDYFILADLSREVYGIAREEDTKEKYLENTKKVIEALLIKLSIFSKQLPIKFTEPEVDFQHSSEFDLVYDSKELSTTIADRLKEMYPEVSVTHVDKIFDKEGVEVLGKAVNGAVAYSKKAALDTLPHEYAHVYVDILRPTSFVSNVIKNVAKLHETTDKEAEEILVQYMGERYVEWVGGKRKPSLDKEKKTLGLADRMWGKVKEFFTTNRFEKAQTAAKKALKQTTAKEMETLAKRFFDGVNRDAVRSASKERYSKVDTEKTFTDFRFFYASDEVNEGKNSVLPVQKLKGMTTSDMLKCIN